MANTYVVTVVDGGGALPLVQAGNHRNSLKKLCNRILQFASGHATTSATVSVRTGAANATGTITMASSSGTVGATINGVAVTVTWGTSDTLSAAALAAAINASVNALVAGHVTATSALGVVTLTAVQAGLAGNTITLAASGTNVTASGSGRLTGGAETLTTFAL